MAGGRPYTDEEAAFLSNLWAQDFSNEYVFAEYKRAFPDVDRSFVALSRAKTQTRCIREGIENRKKMMTKVLRETRELDEGVTIEEPKRPQELSPERAWASAERTNEARAEYFRERHHVTIRFKTNKPIALSFVSDQHLSQDSANEMIRMRQDAMLIRDTSGMFAVLGGDGVDNHIKHISAMVAGASSPAMEYELYNHYLKMFGLSIAAACSGNHDDWTKDVSAVDAMKEIYQRQRIFYAPDFIVINVEILGDNDEVTQSYMVKIRHQYRFNSTLNPTHSMKRMWEQDAHDFDVGVICHLHDAAMEPFMRHGLQRWAFRPGSYQVGTGYSRRIGFPPSKPTCPTIVLWPNRRELVGFDDARKAASYLTYLRKNWPDSDFPY